MSSVYFIQCGTGGPIKIGIASDVNKRLGSLQTGHHEQLHLLAHIEAYERFEAMLHKRFKRGLIRGEWFKPDTPGLPDLIASLLRDTVPDWAAPHVRMKEAAPLEETSLPEADPFTESCQRCRWPVEDELAFRGILTCYRCLADLGERAA